MAIFVICYLTFMAVCDTLTVLRDGRFVAALSKGIGSFVQAFLVFTSNSYKIVEFQMMKEKRLKAQMALEKAG